MSEDRADGVTVISELGGASPEGMRTALKELAVRSDGKRRRTWAVLGALELTSLDPGADVRLAHMDLGRFVVRLDVSRLVVIGSAAGGIHAGAVLEGSWGQESVHVGDVDAAVTLVCAQVAAPDVVLVKGSTSAGLDRVVTALLNTADAVP